MDGLLVELIKIVTFQYILKICQISFLYIRFSRAKIFSTLSAWMNLSHKINKPMNVSQKTLLCRLFLKPWRLKIAKPYVDRTAQSAIGIDNWHRICQCCQTWKTNQFWEECKKKELRWTLSTFIGFLATSQADGWFMVLQPKLKEPHVLCGPEESRDLQENTEGVILRGSKYNTQKKKLYNHHRVLAMLPSRPHTTSQWVENSELVSLYFQRKWLILSNCRSRVEFLIGCLTVFDAHPSNFVSYFCFVECLLVKFLSLFVTVLIKTE